jgi:hypothetical protein
MKTASLPRTTTAFFTSLLGFSVLGFVGARAAAPAPAVAGVSPVEMIQSFEDNNGDHPGKRKSHTKGISRGRGVCRFQGRCGAEPLGLVLGEARTRDRPVFARNG